jgi:hypothetical protein
VDAEGNLYIADKWEHRVRRVDASGIITTFAGGGTPGSCGDGGPSSLSCLDNPADVAVDSSGNVYIAELGGHRVRKVDVSGIITLFAGNSTPSYSGDGGPATSAAISFPTGVEADGAGNVFISTPRELAGLGGRVRRVDSTGTITTVAGTGVYGFSGDGGPAVLGQMAAPARIALDAAGNLYIADVFNNRIRMVEGLGEIPAPTFSGSTPASPSNQNTFLAQGTAVEGSTVNLYTDASCQGPVAGSGTYAEFASPGISITVSSDSTTAVYATATDVSGNVSACSPDPLLYVEDSTPPDVTIDSAPPDPSNDLSPTWAFTAEAGSTSQCEVLGGETVVEPLAACVSPASFDLSGESDGDYTLEVTAVDAAGNQGSASSTYTLDSTGPDSPTITGGPSGPTNDVTPAWTFTSDPGTTTECELVGISSFSPCTGASGYDLSGEPDGEYTFRVQARDAAGNPSSPTVRVITLDTDEPLTPTIQSAPTSPGNSTSPGWTFSTEQGTTAECALSGVSSFAPCGSPATFDLDGQSDGSYLFSVRAVDPAGNRSATDTDTYTLDTTPPAVAITSGPSSPGNARDPSWTFSSQAGATTRCELSGPGGTVVPYSDCSSPADLDLTGRPDGVYTFSVDATDSAGNTGDADTSTYTLDTTGPTVDITSGPAPVSSERNPEWTFSTEAGAATECELSDSTGVIRAFEPCSSPQDYVLTGQPDDTYSFRVRATDPTGNLGPATSSAYTLDTSGPVSSVTSSPPSPGSIRAAQWSFTAESGATTECELSGDGGAIEPFEPCSSPQAYDLTGRDDGPYTFSVRATDEAGNPGAPASDTYILDTQGPAVAITFAPESPGNDPTPVWSFTTELGATPECELSRGGTVVSPWGGCLSPATYSLGAQGEYTLRLRATDEAGNTGPVEADVYILDTVGPAVSITPPDSPGNDRTPSWTFSTEPEASAECELSDSGGVLRPLEPCSSPASYDLAGLPDGAYTLRIVATDEAGNSGPDGSSGYLLDTTGPATAIDFAPTSPGSGTNPSWSFSTEAGASARCELAYGPVILHPFAPCDSPKAYGLGGSLDGDYTFRVRADDQLGNSGPVTSSTYTLDRAGPAAPVITAAPASPGSDTSLEWSFTTEVGTTTECELVRDTTVLRAFAPCGGSFAHDISGRPDGEFTFRVRALDSLGNTGASATSGYTLDTRGPDVVIDWEPTSPGNERTPTWGFSTEVGATAECELRLGSTAVRPYAACASPVPFDLVGEPDGDYSISIRASDSLGNLGSSAGSDYELDTTPPEVTITAGPGAAGTDRTPSWSFTTETGASTECLLEGGGEVVRAWATCSDSETFDLGTKPDANYTFQVRAEDQVGNLGPEALQTYTLASPAAEAPPPEGGTQPPAVTPPAPDGESGDGRGDKDSGGDRGGEKEGEDKTGGDKDRGGTDDDGGATELPVPGGPAPVPVGDPVADPEQQGPTGDAPAAERDSERDPKPELPEEVQEPEAATDPPASEADRKPEEHLSRRPSVLGEVLANVGLVVSSLIRQPVFPLVLVLLMFVFLVAQNRIDRRDPKLALAPVHPDPNLDFEAP